MMENIIYDFSVEKDILTGICGAEPLYEYGAFLRGADTPFVRHNIDKRLNPRLSLPNAESVIMFGVGYKKRPPRPEDGIPRGEIASFAGYQDYHTVIKKLITGLAERLMPHDYVIGVDTGPLPEKFLAVKCGMGYIGRNNLLITKKFGSYLNLGYMITSLKLTSTTSFSSSSAASHVDCGDCDVCLPRCPGGAISAKKPFDWSLCASYITQKKGALTAAEEDIIRGKIYGCDACQEYCPHNAHVEMSDANDAKVFYPRLSKLSGINNDEYAHLYGNTAAGWIGAETVRRNAEIAIKY